MDLFKANRQWSTRPKDERFESLEALHAAVSGYRADARVKSLPFNTIKAQAIGDEIALVGPANNPATLTHWAFGQLAARAEAPGSYLRTLPPALAADCINTGLARRADSDPASILFHQNGGLIARAINSERYTRIWNADISSRLLTLQAGGIWQPAPAAFDGSRGLYASDHDLFAFLVDNNRRVFEQAPGGGLSRGFFTWNSEVGAATFGVCRFLYAYVCGNHIVWGASEVAEIRLRHVGNVDERAFQELEAELVKYAESSASEDEARITKTRAYALGATKEEVLDRLFGLRVPALTRKVAEAAYDLAVEHEDWYGSPRSAWGVSNGLTEYSQTLPYADARVALDRAAGKVLELAF